MGTSRMSTGKDGGRSAAPPKQLRPFAAIGSLSCMPRFVAFLRAINVGGHVVKMDALRKHFAALRLSQVETFIASGNVIFDTKDADAAALEERIERQLEKKLGYEVATFLRTPAELSAAAAHQAFGPHDPDEDGPSLHVGFLKAVPTAKARQLLLESRTPTDEFHANGREFYWRAHVGIGQSPVTGAKLEKSLGMQFTMRNITTVRKLAHKVAE
jgi:uncharacterized protein (DUF1697 family)